MSQIAIAGEVVTTVTANLRQGAASIKAPVLRKLAPGTHINVAALVVGDSIQGNAHWYQSDGETFIWAGACGPLTTNLAATPAAVPSGVPNVVDLYDGDRVASFATAQGAGVLGIIHKATTGATGHDTMYAERRTAARAAGVLWGAYHWGTAAPVEDQVTNFLSIADPDADTLVALDFERSPGNQMTLDGARQFLTLIEQNLGRRAVLYSGDWVKSQLGNTVDPFFGAHRLWLAQYGAKPKVQASWKTFWLWQYTDGTDTPTPVPGIPGNTKGQVDCDHYVGSDAQLRAEWAS